MLRYTCALAFLSCCILATSPAIGADKKSEETSPKKGSEIYLDEVIVSVPMQQKLSGATIPVNILSEEELTLNVGTSIGETLKLQPGIHSQSFGPGVGLPVIRGQSGPRVRVLSNGLGSNDASQVSPDHGSSVTPLLADRIEVLRGPATLLYGSGAIGGVVNVIDGRIPEQVPDKLIGGALQQRFNSASNETSTAIKIEGGKNHLAYHFDGFYQDRGNVSIGGQAIDAARAQVSQPGLAVTQNTQGFIGNSSADAKGGTAGFSLVGDAGFIGVSGNHLKRNYGVPPEGTDDGESIRIPLEQNKFDFKSELIEPFSFVEKVRMRLSYTDYEHREVADGETEALFTNDTFEGRLEVPHKPLGPLHGVFGFQAISSEFSAIEVEDNEAIVPSSQINSYGVFAQESLDLGSVTTEFGIRVENASIDPEGLAHPFRSFNPVSASVSGLWDINDQNKASVTLTRSQRAPQVQELFFEGMHEATRSFQRGNPNLEMETSTNLDFGYRFVSDWMVAELDLFHNWVDDYIFQQRTGSMVDGAPEVLTRQAYANFMGYEARLIFPLMDNETGSVDLTLFSDFTRGRLVNMDDVPRQPPLRWGFQVDYINGQWNSNLRLTRNEAQNDPGGNEAETPGYVLLNLSTNYKVLDFHGTDVLLFAKANNLLNETIRNSTSFLRNFAPEAGRSAEIGVRVNF